MKDQVQTFRMITGEDIIGVVTDKGNMVSVKQPALIMLMTDETQKQVTPMLRPWALFAKDATVMLSMTHIMFMVDPVPEIEQMYNQATGRIQVVPAGALPPTPAGGKLELVKG